MVMVMITNLALSISIGKFFSFKFSNFIQFFHFDDVINIYHFYSMLPSPFATDLEIHDQLVSTYKFDLSALQFYRLFVSQFHV